MSRLLQLHDKAAMTPNGIKHIEGTFKMRLNRKALWGMLFAGLTILLCVYVWPIVTKVNADLNAYSTKQAISNDYTLHTTPLPQSVVDDLCFKFGLEASNEHCRPGATVYGPDFFDEIKSYFKNLPKEDRTYEIVQDKLGTYLEYCEKPDPQGDYRCGYDLRGDGVYHIGVYFHQDGFYWQVQAATGGS